MPLVHSGSDKAFKTNVGTLMHDVGKSPHVQSRVQALAIAYDTKRRAGRAYGGVVGYDDGGAVPPQMPMPGSPSPGVMPAPGMAMGAPPPAPGSMPPPSMGLAPPATPAPPPGIPQNAAPPGIAQNAPPAGPPPGPVEPMQRPLMARGGVAHRATGGFAMEKSAHMSPPWFMKNQVRSTLHTGPILSAVPGRTDNHKTHVPSGSYVIPADIVSGRGQGNTIAGSANLSKLFAMGPYGAGTMPIRRGSGAPRPPRARADGGEADGVGQPVPVDLAGGEIVVPPENLMKTVHPDLKEAHRIMDAWVLAERKKLRQTLAKLPGPAKD